MTPRRKLPGGVTPFTTALGHPFPLPVPARCLSWHQSPHALTRIFLFSSGGDRRERPARASDAWTTKVPTLAHHTTRDVRRSNVAPFTVLRKAANLTFLDPRTRLSVCFVSSMTSRYSNGSVGGHEVEDDTETLAERVDEYCAHIPTSTSIRSLLHSGRGDRLYLDTILESQYRGRPRAPSPSSLRTSLLPSSPKWTSPRHSHVPPSTFPNDHHMHHPENDDDSDHDDERHLFPNSDDSQVVSAENEHGPQELVTPTTTEIDTTSKTSNVSNQAGYGSSLSSFSSPFAVSTPSLRSKSNNELFQQEDVRPEDRLWVRPPPPPPSVGRQDEIDDEAEESPEAHRMNDKRQSQKLLLFQLGTFVRQELRVRLAHRIRDLDQVPMMRDMPAVQAVKGIYVQSFRQLLEGPEQLRTVQNEINFARLLNRLYQNHSSVLVQMARGAYELREAVRDGRIAGTVDENGTVTDFEHMVSCHEFLDRFYLSRIGIRVLAGHYLALRSQIQNVHETTWTKGRPSNANARTAHPEKPPVEVGLIHGQTSPSAIVRHAADDVTRMCIAQYGIAPRILLTGRMDLTFPYIPTYLHYVVLELLKNAVRATVEKHGNRAILWNTRTIGVHAALSNSLPPVTVVVADGDDNEDVVIKISDEGGGIARSQMDKIWSYLYTTADPSIQRAYLEEKKAHDGSNNDTSNTFTDHSSYNAPIAGLGYGLPISRSYCRYFGGDLDLMSMEGYGTDAFLYLKRLGDSKEPTLDLE